MADTHEKLRNIGIIAHVDAGKTTLSERILYLCHVIRHMGEVNDGSTVLDFLPEEQVRGITIGAACISCPWNGVRINLVDTPGHIDFTYEVDRIVRIIDGAVVVFSAVDGVEPQSEMVWRQANRYHLPRLVFINKIDRPEADYKSVLTDLVARLGARPALLTIPLKGSSGLLGIIDILRLEALYFDPKTLRTEYKRKPLFGQELAAAKILREQLAENLAEVDDDFMEIWATNQWTTTDCLAALQRATRSCAVVPIYCGSAKSCIGIQPLLDGVTTLLPSPQTFPGTDAVGFVFKLVFHKTSRVTWIRLYSGSLADGDTISTNRNAEPHTIRLYRIDAEQILAVDTARAGDIVAVTGLTASTGDTITTGQNAPPLPPLPKRPPVIARALEPATDSEYDLLTEALTRFQEEDPSLHVSTAESGSYLVAGMGELHLQVLLDRLTREYDLHVQARAPQVVLRESVARSSSSATQTLSLSIDPAPRGSGNSIVLADDLTLSTDAKTFLSEAIKRTLACGVTYGPLTDTKVTVSACLCAEDRESIDKATEELLPRMLEEAGTICLEPIMHLTLVCTDATLGNCLNEVTRSHGTILEILEENQQKVVHAEAALKDIVDLQSRLHSATSGRCSLLPRFLRFDSVAR